MSRVLGRWREDLRAVLPSWIVARLLVGVAWVLAAGVVDRSAPGHQTLRQQEGLIAWDALIYRDISGRGYADLNVENQRFFPLFPLVGRLLTPLFEGDSTVAMVVLANVAALVAGVLVYRLVRYERGDDALAERAVWALNLSPAAFVLVWGYSEALFVALSVGAFLAARRDRFVLAAACALAAALTRPLGILLAAPLAIEALRSWHWAAARDQTARLVAVAAPVAGLGLFLSWAGYALGDPFSPFRQQGNYRTSMDPVRALLDAVADLAGADVAEGLHLPFALAFLALLVVVGRRWPVSYTAFAGLMLVVAISAENLNSLERYAFSAFPLLLALADVTRTVRHERLALAVCGNGLVALCALAWLGVFVP